jgi:hypothetical protein
LCQTLSSLIVTCLSPPPTFMSLLMIWNWL